MSDKPGKSPSPSTADSKAPVQRPMYPWPPGKSLESFMDKLSEAWVKGQKRKAGEENLKP